MTLRPQNSNSLRRKEYAAFTLPEMLMSVATGVLILVSVVTVFVFVNRSVDAMGNYEELDRQSRISLDLMSQDIRQCGGLTNYTTNALYFTNQDGSLLKYVWDGSNYLTYTNSSTTNAGCPRGGTLLKGCQYLKFTVFQRNPIPGTTMTFTNASSADLVKLVVMDWICRRTNFTSLTDSESVQTAKVVMRN